MPTAFHPEALEQVHGQPPNAVYVNGEDYVVGDDGLIRDIPSRDVAELAELYDVDVSALNADDETARTESDPSTDAVSGSPSDLIDKGECPWCDEYTGDHVGQHASSAHPDAWEQYKED